MDAEDKRHIENLLKGHQRRLHLLEQRAATLGNNAPPELIIEIQDLQEVINRLKVQIEHEESNGQAALKNEHKKDTAKDRGSPDKQSWFVPLVIALIGALATIGAAWIGSKGNGVSLQPTAASIVQPTAALVAQTPITTPSTAPTAVPIAGPWIGELKHDPTSGFILARAAEIDVRNFTTEVRFYNPYDRSKDNWDYGIGFRQNKDTVKNYRLTVYSSKSWSLCIFDSNANPKCPFIARGEIPNLDVTPNGSNLLRLEVKDSKAKFFVNGTLIDTLDVSALDFPGIVSIAVDHQVEGEFTRYEDFIVWSIP